MLSTAATTATKPNAPTVRTEPRETPCKREEREPINHAAKGEERATGRICALPCDCAPLPPTMPTDDAPLDELLAAMDVIEASWEAAGVGVGTPEGGRPDFRPWGEMPRKNREVNVGFDL